MFNLWVRIITTLSLLTLTRCGAGVGSALRADCTDCSTQGLVIEPPTITPTKAKVSGSFFNDFDAVNFDANSHTLNLKLPLNGNIAFSDEGEVLRLSQNSFISINDLSSQIPFLNLSLNLDDIKLLQKGNTTNTSPHPKFSFDNQDAYFVTELEVSDDPDLNAWIFLGKKSLHIFIESALNPYVLQQFPIRDSNDALVGKFTQLPHTDDVRGGYILTFNFSSQID